MATGRRGPAPQPAAVKKAKGNPGKRPISTEQMEAQAEEAGADFAPGADFSESPSGGEGGGAAVPAIAHPSWLNEDAKKVWDRLAPRLATMKILQHIDTETFGRYCVNFARWIDLQKDIREKGETYTSESPHGTYIRVNPSVMIASRLDRELMMQEQNFALNPADRQRLFAARAAAGLGAGGADLFGQSEGERGEGKPSENPDRPRSAVGFLN